MNDLISIIDALEQLNAKINNGIIKNVIEILSNVDINKIEVWVQFYKNPNNQITGMLIKCNTKEELLDIIKSKIEKFEMFNGKWFIVRDPNLFNTERFYEADLHKYELKDLQYRWDLE